MSIVNLDMYISRTKDRINELKEYINTPKFHTRLNLDTLNNNYLMLAYLEALKAGMIH